jgi:hypothetical protein
MWWSAVPRPSLARTLGLALAVAVAALGAQAHAAGAAGLVNLAALTAPQGGTITVAGNVSTSSNCPAGASVQLTATPTTGLFPNGLGPHAARDANGNFVATFTIPTTTPAGTYTIGVICGSTTVGSTQTLTVTASTPTKPAITTSPASAARGQAVTISGVVPTSGGASCPAGDAAQLTSSAALFPPDGFGPQAARDATGHFLVNFTIPATTPPGSYTIGVRCGGGNTGIAIGLQVTATAATTTTSTTSTTVPATTTTTTVPSATTLAPTATTTPVTSVVTTTTTTLAQPATKKASKNSSLRWVALAVLVIVILAVAAALLRRRPGPTPG